MKITRLSSGSKESINLELEGACQPQPITPMRFEAPYGMNGMDDFYVEVASWTRSLIDQQTLRKLFHYAIKGGSFADSFSDLAKAARGREEMGLDTVAPQIYAEASKGDEAFEAFGVKFPSEQVTRWRIVVLTGVQLYLLMYLRQLFNRLKPDDPGWDVPWMAMDQSLLARIMLFSSFCVLPFVAALGLLLQAKLQLFPEGWISWHGPQIHRSEVIQILLMIAGLCVSVTLAILSWKYRPRLSQPVAPAQLFE
jgi:hypothetical protein